MKKREKEEKKKSLRPSKNLLTLKFKLIFNLIQLSEMHGAGRVKCKLK